MREYKITKLTSNKRLIDKQNDSIEKLDDIRKIMSSSSSDNLEQTPVKIKKKMVNTTTKKKKPVLKKYTNRQSLGKVKQIPTIEQNNQQSDQKMDPLKIKRKYSNI